MDVVLTRQVLGNLTNKLKQMGIYNNTLIVHTSDNGGPAGVEASGHCALRIWCLSLSLLLLQ